MFLKVQIIVTFLCVFVSPTVLFAQSNVLKSTAKVVNGRSISYATPLIQTGKMGIKRSPYIVSDRQIGAEIVKGHVLSPVGKAQHVQFDQIARKIDFLGVSLSRAIADQVVKPADRMPVSFPGFYYNFKQQWKQAVTKNPRLIDRLAYLLEAAYGGQARFTGLFVPNFQGISRQSLIPLQRGVSGKKAFYQVLALAKNRSTGFLVIVVKGNTRRPKDVLLVDLEHEQFISFNRSKAQAWAEIDQERTATEPWEEENSYLNAWRNDPLKIDRRSTQGIILDTGSKGMIWVSISGNSWMGYHLNLQEAHTEREVEEGNAILNAWNKGYYILYDDWGTKPVLFAASKGKPLFPTVEEVDAYVAKQRASYLSK